MSAQMTRPAPIIPAGPNSLAACATRRGVLGVIAAMPALTAVTPAFGASAQDDWHGLVIAYRRHKTEWETLNLIHEDRQLEFKRQRSPAPTPPQLVEPVRQDMTIAEIKAIPLDKVEADYEAEMAEWRIRCEPLEREITGPAKAAAEAAWCRYSETLTAIEAYPSPTLQILAEKAELIAAEYDCDDDHIQSVFADVRRLAGKEARS